MAEYGPEQLQFAGIEHRSVEERQTVQRAESAPDKAQLDIPYHDTASPSRHEAFQALETIQRTLNSDWVAAHRPEWKAPEPAWKQVDQSHEYER